MRLEKMLRRMTVPVIAGVVALTSMQCQYATEAKDEQEQQAIPPPIVILPETNIYERQEEIPKIGSTSESPKIRYTFVPEIRSFSNVRGQTFNSSYDSTRVAAYVHAAGSWWVKPYYAAPLTRINRDGTFTFDYTTGGVDEFADRINAYLVRWDYIPPSNSLPDMNNPKVLAGVTINRQ